MARSRSDSKTVRQAPRRRGSQSRARAGGGEGRVQRRRPGREPGGGGATRRRRHRHALSPFPDPRGAVRGGLSARGRAARRTGGTVEERGRRRSTRLRRWLRSNVEFVATKKGMSAALALAVHGSSELYAYSFDRLTKAVGALLDRAVAAGEIRADISPEDVLRALVGMCYMHDQPGWQSERAAAAGCLCRWSSRANRRCQAGGIGSATRGRRDEEDASAEGISQAPQLDMEQWRHELNRANGRWPCAVPQAQWFQSVMMTCEIASSGPIMTLRKSATIARRGSAGRPNFVQGPGGFRRCLPVWKGLMW